MTEAGAEGIAYKGSDGDERVEEEWVVASKEKVSFIL